MAYSCNCSSFPHLWSSPSVTVYATIFFSVTLLTLRPETRDPPFLPMPPCCFLFYLPLSPTFLSLSSSPLPSLCWEILTPAGSMSSSSPFLQHALPTMATTPPLNLPSYNCRGFDTPEKHSQILYHFHKMQTDILLLHFRSGSTPAVHNRYYATWLHSTNPLAKSKGVSIAFHRSFHLH